MQHLVSAVVGGLLVSIALLLFRADAPATVAPAAAVRTELVDVEARAQFAALEERISSLRVAGVAGGSVDRAAARVVADSSTVPDLVARIDALARRVDELEQRMVLGSVHEPAAPSEHRRAALAQALEGGHWLHHKPERFVAMLVQVPLRIEWLESGSGDPKAVQAQLRELVNELCSLQQHRRAKAAIERFGPTSGFAEWQLDELRFQAAFRPDERIEIARRLAVSPLDPVVKAWVMYQAAADLHNLGRRTDALTMLESLLQQCPDAPMAESAAKLRSQILSDR